MSVLGAAALMGGASLLGGLMNADSAKQTNQIAQQQFERNMAFQRWQYNDMKRYNSPSNQVRMLRQAGLNPAITLANGFSPTPISDVGGVSTTASMSPVDYSGVMSSAGSLANALSGAELTSSQTALNLASRDKVVQESIQKQIENLYLHGDKQLAQQQQRWLNAISSKQFEFLNSSLDDRLLQEKESALTATANRVLQSYIGNNAQRYVEAGIGEQLAHAAALYASRQLSLKEAHESFMRTVRNYGVTKGDALDMFDASLDFLLEQANTENAKQYEHYMSGWTSANIPTSPGLYQSGEAINRTVTRTRQRSQNELRRYYRRRHSK